VNAADLPRRRFLHLAASAAALPAVSRDAKAQSYPSRPITMIVGYAAGAATDTIGRIIAERMVVHGIDAFAAEPDGGLITTPAVSLAYVKMINTPTSAMKKSSTRLRLMF
jgi:hypothetical protein